MTPSRLKKFENWYIIEGHKLARSPKKLALEAWDTCLRIEKARSRKVYIKEIKKELLK